MAKMTAKTIEDYGVDLEEFTRRWHDRTHTVPALCDWTGLTTSQILRLRRMMGLPPRKPAEQIFHRKTIVDRDAFIAAWNDRTLSAADLRARFRLAKSTATKVAQRLGLPPRHLMTDEEKADICRLYQHECRTLDQIAAVYHVSASRITSILQDRGIAIRKRSDYQNQPRARKEGDPPRKTNFALVAKTVERGNPIDPDAKILMRDFAPVCRARIVNPRAPADHWIVGSRRVPEREMRAMAAKRRAARAEEARAW